MPKISQLTSIPNPLTSSDSFYVVQSEESHKATIFDLETFLANILLEEFTAQTSVTVVHNFGTFPVIQVLNSLDSMIIPLTITHNSINDFTVTFTSGTTGTIVVWIQ